MHIKEVLNLRATLNMPDDLISEVQKLSGEKSRTKAIVAAMEEFVRDKKIKKLISMRDKIQIEDVTKELDELALKEKEEQ